MLQNLNKYFIRILQKSKSIKIVINYICNFYCKESIFNIYSNLLFRLLKRVEKQTNTLKFVKKKLNKYLIATIARKKRCQQYSIVVVNNVTKLVIIKDYKVIVFVRTQQIAKLVVIKTK